MVPELSVESDGVKFERQRLKGELVIIAVRSCLRCRLRWQDLCLLLVFRVELVDALQCARNTCCRLKTFESAAPSKKKKKKMHTFGAMQFSI